MGLCMHATNIDLICSGLLKQNKHIFEAIQSNIFSGNRDFNSFSMVTTAFCKDNTKFIMRVISVCVYFLFQLVGMCGISHW